MTTPHAIAEQLFRKHYAYPQQIEITETMVWEARRYRFEQNTYWSIWKSYGVFFAFVVGFFHRQDGTNQLYKIPDEDKTIFQSPKKLRSAFDSEKDFAQYLSSYNIKRMVNQNAAHILAACDRIIDNYNGCVPQTLEELLQFRGYGRKIANMFLNVAFDKPRIAVDIRVFRAAVRLGLLSNNFTERSSLSDADKLQIENSLHRIFANSFFLIEMDYLLFMEGGGVK